MGKKESKPPSRIAKALAKAIAFGEPGSGRGRPADPKDRRAAQKAALNAANAQAAWQRSQEAEIARLSAVGEVAEAQRLAADLANRLRRG